MDGFSQDANGLSTQQSDCSAEQVHLQFSNNLDGLLRDSNGDVIDLDLCDFRHQCYYGPDYQRCAFFERTSKYVFKNGKLFKVTESYV